MILSIIEFSRVSISIRVSYLSMALNDACFEFALKDSIVFESEFSLSLELIVGEFAYID
jgi:hypothetical protein